MVYVIAYDLKEPNTPADYAKIIDAIKAYGTWMRLEQSVWLIDSEKTAIQLRDELREQIRSKDVLFIAPIGGAWAARNLGDNRKTWLDQRKF